MRTNAKGAFIESRHQIEGHGSTYRCTGCGREFHTGDMNKPSNYWPSRDGARYDGLNKARAQRHADSCKGDES